MSGNVKIKNMSETLNEKKIARRKFLGSAATACILPCLGIQSLLAMSDKTNKADDQEAEIGIKHKFDKRYPYIMSYQEAFNMRYEEFIQFAKDLEKEMGKEKLIEFLKTRTEKKMFEYGKSQAEGIKNNSFKRYVSQYKAPHYDNTLTLEIVEETDTTFELKVTECIWASAFLKQKAGEIGFASICYGDYSWPKGFNSKIRMERNKTLMQGHDCCNHRYIFEE
jgi:L-2-amino-thiazoline-4-carboxylic acid hydrolase